MADAPVLTLATGDAAGEGTGDAAGLAAAPGDAAGDAAGLAGSVGLAAVGEGAGDEQAASSTASPINNVVARMRRSFHPGSESAPSLRADGIV